MWKHEILQDTANAFKHPAGDPAILKLCHELLRQSTCFYFGEFFDFKEIESSLVGQQINMPNPPYSSTLIEYKFENIPAGRERSCQTEKSSKRAILYTEIPLYGRTIIMFLYYDAKKRWVLYPCFFTQKDIKIPGQIFTFYPKIKDYLEVTEGVYYDIKDEINNTGILLTILNTRNMTTKLVMPPEKLNKARIKRKKEPLEKYYILEVVKGVPKTKYQGEVPWDYRPPAERALHLCRGHFKTYTEEAPLFGKYTGTFWWQPSLRGKEENGIIRKDYSVSTHTEQA